MILSAFRLVPALLFLVLPFMALRGAGTYDLNAEQDARLKKFMPRSYDKLKRRAPVHAVTIGDSVMNMYGYTPEYGNTLGAYQTIFLQELANLFYYTGGIRVIRPQGGHPEKLHELTGSEITLQNLARGGKFMLHAMQTLTTSAFENKPDIVLVSFGINDSIAGCSLSTYRVALQNVIDVVKAQDADILLFGPSVVVPDPPEQGLSYTRPYADVMREVAEANGIFYADLGDLSWLIRIEEIKTPYKKPKAPTAPGTATTPAPEVGAEKPASEADKKGKEAPATPAPTEGDGKTAAVAAATPPVESPVKMPSESDYETDPEKRAAKLFDFIVNDYRKFFNHGTTTDWVHPDKAFHRLLGQRLYKELINGPKELPWKVANPVATVQSADNIVLTYQLENPSDKDLTVTVLPLVASAWRPQDVPTEVPIKAKKKADVSITYVKTASSPIVMQIDDAYLRLPVLLAGGGTARIETMRAVVTPVNVFWTNNVQHNLEGSVELTGTISNTSDKPVKGKWQADWKEQNWSGDVALEPGAKAPVKLVVKLPDGATVPRDKGILAFRITVDGQTLAFDRGLEMSRNIGLKESVTMVSPNAAPGGDGAGGKKIVFRADADKSALYLTWDIEGVNLLDNPQNSIAAYAEVNLDARSYGKRLMPGATDVIRLTCGAADGDGESSALLPWVFGTGYGMYYDPKAVKVKMTSRTDGTRRMVVALPRAYLYLHEWSLGNGNSQIGITNTLFVWQQDSAGNAGYEAFVLSDNGYYRDDAESVMALELTDKPTRRFTVHFY